MGRGEKRRIEAGANENKGGIGEEMKGRREKR